MDGSLKKRRNKGIYYENLTIDNLYKSYNIVKRTCKNKSEIYKFSLNLSTNINYIYKCLYNKNYRFNKYRIFMIFEPKARLVMSSTVSDKIVNHFITNYYLLPLLEGSLINSNVATRKGKGTSYSDKLLMSYLNKLNINSHGYIYSLKIDISKYFYSIDHEILIEMLRKKIYDSDVICLIKSVISCTNKDYVNSKISFYNYKYGTDIPFYENNKGLSIGAVSSQFLAIFYLNDLDHYIKEKLLCKYYIRYMDDFLILDTSKKKLMYVFDRINDYLGRLKLKLNKKSNIYRLDKGITFLGYKYSVRNGKVIKYYNKVTYTRIRNRLRYLYNNDKISFYRSYSSYNGYFMKRGIFKMKSMEMCDLYKEKYKDTIILIKEGIFYKCYREDAKIMWYLFDYKYINDSLGFSSNSYDKVVNKLIKLNISFMIIDKSSIIINSYIDNRVYDLYKNLALDSFDTNEKKESLINKLKMVLDKNIKYYEEISSFLDSF